MLKNETPSLTGKVSKGGMVFQAASITPEYANRSFDAKTFAASLLAERLCISPCLAGIVVELAGLAGHGGRA